MRGVWTRALMFAATAVLIVASGMPSAHAIHWYRGPGGGCTPADGAITDDAPDTEPNVVRTIVMGHNVFAEGVSGFDVTQLVAPEEIVVKVGESIRWTWNSAHCHSVTSQAFVDVEQATRVFESGFHYPVTPPESPQVAPGAFEYPLLDETPTLSYTHTFTAPGSFGYFCVHHASIGMTGVIQVTA